MTTLYYVVVYCMFFVESMHRAASLGEVSVPGCIVGCHWTLDMRKSFAIGPCANLEFGIRMNVFVGVKHFHLKLERSQSINNTETSHNCTRPVLYRPLHCISLESNFDHYDFTKLENILNT